MSRTVALGLALVAGALALLLLWRVQQERGGVARSQGEDAPAPFVEPLVQLVPPPPAVDVAVTEASALEEPPAAGATRRPEPLAEQPRISGTVRVPGGIPPGEVVELWGDVVWYSRSAAPRSVKTRVASDGSFTLALPEDAKAARLSLESRFLALPHSERVRVGETGVVLEPCVYAAVVGDVVPPRSVSRRSWADMEVSWKAARSLDLDPEAEQCVWRSPTRDKPARPDRRGAFELPLVPAGIALELHAENPFGPVWSRGVGPLAPGEVHRLEIALEPGITISGRVIDEHGAPVAGAYVAADGAEDSRFGGCAPCRTDAEGRFELTRLPRAALRISAHAPDLARAAGATIDGAAGDVRDVVLAVIRGGCIEGRVRWRNGTAVDGFELRATGPEYEESKYVEGERFRLCGLEDESLRVEVRAERPGVIGLARADEVRPGAAPLALVLAESPGFDLRVSVVDEEDAVIQGASVRATLSGPGERSEPATEWQRGSHILKGLEAGDWTVAADRAGYLSSSRNVLVGASNDALRLVLARAGRIRGRVVDSAGAPVEGAWVGEEERGASVGRLLALDPASAARLLARAEGATDAHGRFEIVPDSALVSLVAWKQGFSRSESVSLEVGSGESIDDVVLVLRVPGE